MATGLATPSLREALRYRNPFGGETLGGLRSGMDSTWNDFRYGPVSAGSFEEQNMRDNQPAPAAPVAAPLATPPIQPALAVPGNPFAVPGVSPAGAAVAGGLIGADQQAQMAKYQDALKSAGVNLKPDQAPGDFALAHKNALAIYNNIFGGPGGTTTNAPSVGSPGSASGLPFGVPVTAYAPTDLRNAALGVDGSPVTGFGGTQVTGMAGTVGNTMNPVGGSGWIQPGGLPQYKQTGARFTLTQNPNTVPGAPGYVPRTAAAPAPVSMAAAPASQTPFDKASGAYLASQGGAAYTAPDGSMFVRDAHGRLQAAGSNPELAAKAAGQKTGAETEARTQTEDAVKFNGSIRDAAEDSRIRADSISQVMDLYGKGATSGAGQPYFTAINAALARAGVPNANISNQQELEKQMAALGLQYRRTLMKGTGQVSDYETKQAEKAFPNSSLTKEANMHLFQIMQRLDQRNEALENERIRLQKMGLPSTQIRQEVEQMRDSMPLGIEGAASAQAATAPVKVGKYSVTVH